MTSNSRSAVLHLGLIGVLIILGLVLPTYHQGNLARILVLATYAIGYNVLFGYTGLLSLGHAMFFAAGMYGCGLAMYLGGLSVLPAFAVGLICAAALSGIVALLALRTIGIAPEIVPEMITATSLCRNTSHSNICVRSSFSRTPISTRPNDICIIRAVTNRATAKRTKAAKNRVVGSVSA